MEHDLDHFFELSLDLHVVSSPHGYFKHVSKSVVDILGWTPEEFLSRPYIDFVHPDDQPATLLEVDRQMKAGHKVLHFENRYLHRDGSWRVLSWKSMPYGGLMYATARDVTELKLIEQAMADAKNHAEAANRELEAFSYSVAHDLRAPLRSISGFSQELSKSCRDALGEKGDRYLRLIQESTRHMARLIDDLLALSKVSRCAMAHENVDLSALAREACARLKQSEPARRIDVTIQDGLTSRGDSRLLSIVIDNLLGNAWKYTSRRADPCIQFGGVRRNDVCEYFVRDNGAGFDMSHVHKLFGVFERLHHADEFEGTGVGLATVKRIVERHGGEVRADGKVGAGASFYFTLPIPHGRPG